jgi:hypothetical protein
VKFQVLTTASTQMYSGMLHRVVWQKFTDVSEVLPALMIEAASTSETSVNFYQTTRRNIPEDSHRKWTDWNGKIVRMYRNYFFKIDH